MTLALYGHPLSSFCQKVLVALYENDTAFEMRVVDFSNETSRAAFKALWPMSKIPVLHDSATDQTIPETSIIIEYLDEKYPGATRFLPRDAEAARLVRLVDRFYDLYVNAPMGKIVTDRLRPSGSNDAYGVEEAGTLLASACELINRKMADRRWAAGETFSMADCAAAPALFYANMVRPFSETHGRVASYLRRLMERPSFARVVREARPYLGLMPK
jgi:glutathione S-transferase